MNPFTPLHNFPPLHLPSLHFTSLHFTSLHFTSLHFTSLHFTSLHLLFYFIKRWQYRKTFLSMCKRRSAMSYTVVYCKRLSLTLTRRRPLLQWLMNDGPGDVKEGRHSIKYPPVCLRDWRKLRKTSGPAANESLELRTKQLSDICPRSLPLQHPYGHCVVNKRGFSEKFSA
jgi:hypothetical protein